MARTDYQPAPTVEARDSAPDDYQHIEANPGAFGGLIAQGVEKLGQGALDASKFYGQVAADNATNNFLQERSKILYGDPNKTIVGPDGQPTQDTGYFGLRGADAMKARPEVMSQLDELIQDQRQGLSTPSSQQQYDVDTRRYRAQTIADVGQHADQQQRVWMTDTNNTTSEIALNALARDPTNPDVLARTQNAVRTSAVRNAQANGEDPKGAVLKADQAVAKMQVESLLPVDPVKAKQVFNANVGVLSSLPNYDFLAARVQTKSQDAQIGPIVDGALGAAATKTASGALPSEQIASNFVSSAFPGAQITSEQRNPEHNASVGGAPNSMHLTGQAIDFRAQPGTTLAQVKDQVSKAGFPATEVLQEIGGKPTAEPVFHIGWRPKDQQSASQPASGGAIPGSAVHTADWYRANYASVLSDIRARAAQADPDDATFPDRAAARGEQRMNDVIRQQELSYKFDSDNVFRALDGSATGGHRPTSVEELENVSPQMRQSWENLQANNPQAALAVESRLLTANSKGAAAGYGSEFYSKLQSVIAPTTDPGYVHDATKLLPYIGTEEQSPLTNTGFSQLTNVLNMRGTPQGEAFVDQLRTFLDSAHSTISGSDARTGIVDHHGDQQFNKFLVTALSNIQAETKAGTSPAQMFDPKNQHYVGQSIYNFTRPMADRVRDMTNDAMTASLYGPKQLDPGRVAAIDGGVKGNFFTPAQGGALKSIMQQLANGRLTRQQAEAQALKIAPQLSGPPSVPAPTP